MKQILVRSLFLRLIFGILITPAQAQAGEISIETDPSTFVMKGYAAHVFYAPTESKSFRLGAGTYGLELPDIMVNMDARNANQGWSATILGSFALFAEYDLSSGRDSGYLGLQLAQQSYRVSNQSQSTDFNNDLLMLSYGYRWYFGQFYLKPWAGAGYQFEISGNNCAAGKCYDVSPFMGFITFHAGYSF